MEQLKIKVKYGDKEVEIYYPLSKRISVEYTENSTLVSAVKAIKDIVDKLKQE